MNASTQTARESTPDQLPSLTESTTSHPSHQSAERPVDAEHAPESAVIASRQTQETPRPHKPRGFAAMDRSLVSAIARKGGKAAHEAGTAHEFTREEARQAGRKGGQATHAKRRSKSEPPAS
jgi:general stress protein YciG